MTQEQLKAVNIIGTKIHQCEEALFLPIIGTYQNFTYDKVNMCPLPEEVCTEIQQVITRYKKKYEKQLKEL